MLVIQLLVVRNGSLDQSTGILQLADQTVNPVLQLLGLLENCLTGLTFHGLCLGHQLNHSASGLVQMLHSLVHFGNIRSGSH